MTRSKVRIYYHFVWATYNREPLLVGDKESAAHNLICHLALEKGCKILAIGGMPDHVHLLVRAPATQSAAQIMQHVKGVSSTQLRENDFQDGFFGWQNQYGVFSLSQRDLAAVTAYVNDQKKRHGAGHLLASLEACEEENDLV